MTVNLTENEFWYLKAMIDDQHEFLCRWLHNIADEDKNLEYEVTRQQIQLIFKIKKKMNKLIGSGDTESG